MHIRLKQRRHVVGHYSGVCGGQRCRSSMRAKHRAAGCQNVSGHRYITFIAPLLTSTPLAESLIWADEPPLSVKSELVSLISVVPFFRLISSLVIFNSDWPIVSVISLSVIFISAPSQWSR